MSGRFVLAQISDVHIGAAPGRTGADCAAQMRAAFAAAAAYRPDAFVLTGDLVNDAKPEEYQELAALLDACAVQAPIYLAPGNHDHRALMRAAFPAHVYLPDAAHLSYAIEDFPVRLVVLDQIAEGSVFGALRDDMADWLDATLSAAPRKPTIIAMHHPPFLTHDRLFDHIGLHGMERFHAIVAKHPQVQRVICGHHHRAATGQVAHAPAMAAPSTAWAFSVSLDPDMDVAQRSPHIGWALHVWKPDAGFSSFVMPL